MNTYNTPTQNYYEYETSDYETTKTDYFNRKPLSEYKFEKPIEVDPKIKYISDSYKLLIVQNIIKDIRLTFLELDNNGYIETLHLLSSLRKDLILDKKLLHSDSTFRIFSSYILNLIDQSDTFDKETFKSLNSNFGINFKKNVLSEKSFQRFRKLNLSLGITSL